MSLKPRNTIDDRYIDDLVCAICGQPNLRVSHLDKFPDFVACTNCGAAFVLEEQGDWIMYGKIPPEYPETSEFALKQWTWHDAVRQRAEEEREGVTPLTPEAPEPTETAAAFEPDEPAPSIAPSDTMDDLSEPEPAPPFVESSGVDLETAGASHPEKSPGERFGAIEEQATTEPEPSPAFGDIASEIASQSPADGPAISEPESASPFEGMGPDIEQGPDQESGPAVETFPPPPIFGEAEGEEVAESEVEPEFSAADEMAGDEMLEKLEPGEEVVPDAQVEDDNLEDLWMEAEPSEEAPRPEPVNPFVSDTPSDLFDMDEEPAFLSDAQAPSTEGEIDFLAEPTTDEVEEELTVSPFIDRLEKELKASAEESPAPAAPAEDRVETPPPFGTPISEAPSMVKETAPAGGHVEPAAPMVETPQTDTEPEFETPEGEPEKGFRYRVVVKGSQLKFPKNVCAHDLQRPVSLGATVRGTLPDPNNPGERNPLAFSLPLCKDCKRRADARSNEEKSALLQAHLISGIVAVFLVVIALVAGFVNVAEDPLISIFVLLLLGVLGYGLPAIFLLSRANRFPPPYDAAYVLSTLLVVDDAGDLQTSFEWRNEGYAELFRQVNRHNAVGETNRVPDKLTLSESQKMEQKKEAPEEAPVDLGEPNPESRES